MSSDVDASFDKETIIMKPAEEYGSGTEDTCGEAWAERLSRAGGIAVGYENQASSAVASGGGQAHDADTARGAEPGAQGPRGGSLRVWRTRLRQRCG